MTSLEDNHRSIRIASFNIHHGAKSDGTLDLEGTARALDKLEADVVGLQEVDRFFSKRSDFVDQAAWLADRLGMHAEFAPMIDLEASAHSAERVGASTRRQYGIALLSRYPITDARMARLPERREIERRGVLVTHLDLDGSLLRVAVTHLATQPSRVRREQFRAVREMVLDEHTPTVIVGDFNGPAFHPLDYHTFTKGLHDAFAATRRGRLARHFLGRTNPVLPFPLRRIDYILATRDIEPKSFKVLRTHASDHLPIVAELEVPVITELPGEGASQAG